MFDIIIRDAKAEDAVDIGNVRYKSWQETYTGLINQEYLDNMSAQKCVEMVEKCIKTTLVAEVENKIAAYLYYEHCKDAEYGDCAIISAIYVLKEYQKNGVGKMLIDTCIKKLTGYRKLILWVVAGNKNAIEFYKKYGFSLDGCKKESVLITPIAGVRMVMDL